MGINKSTFEFPIIYTGVIGKIAIGWGVHQTVADECKQANIKNALIVTTGLKGTGIVDEINSILTSQGISTHIYSGVTSNPKDYCWKIYYKSRQGLHFVKSAISYTIKHTQYSFGKL
jgi:hypothetical protein